jgi:hypothetical protein
MTDVSQWEQLMAETIEAHLQEQADYIPGVNQAPGSGTEGDDPLGLHYADLGPLAFVLNEAMDSTVNRGADRQALMEQIAQVAQANVNDVEAVLTDDMRCPPMNLIQAFATVLSIDSDIIVDAAQKGGCSNLGPIPTVPPGY